MLRFGEMKNVYFFTNIDTSKTFYFVQPFTNKNPI